MKKGFTLIELLVFFGIFATIMVSFTTIFVSMLNLQTGQSAVSTVNEQSQFLLQQIQYYVQNSRLVDMSVGTTGGSSSGGIGAWTQVTASPDSNAGAGQGVAYGNYVYLLEENSSTSTVIDYASPNSNGSITTWATSSVSGVPGYFGQNLLAYNGYLYVLGANTSTVFYAPINSTGSIGSFSKTSLLSPISGEGAAAYNGYFYIAGGSPTTTVATATVDYAPIQGGGAFGAWSSTAALPYTLDGNPVVATVAYNGYLYLVNGYVNGGYPASGMVFYAPINGNGTVSGWATTTFPTAYADGVFSNSAVAVGGYLYSLGGIDTADDYGQNLLYAPLPLSSNTSWSAPASSEILYSPASTYPAVAENGYLYDLGNPTTTYANFLSNSSVAGTSTLTLREASSLVSPTTISLINGVVYLQQGTGGALTPLTSNKVTVSNFSFVRHYNSNTDSVSFSFTMSATSTNQKAYSQSFQSSAAVLAPVPKITLLQQASAVSNNPSVSSLAASYTSNNESGDLLIAVVANTTSSATTTLSDSAGNTWNLVASTSYPAYNTKLIVFDAVNSINSSNTVTAKFGTGAGYATLFLYEYRGASTTVSFNASSTQLQPDTQIPSSGLANATSTTELLFGVTYNGNTAEIPAAGPGFTLETSSTVSHVFVEDSTQYITGPVAATWQYTSTTPSSSALIATFY